MGGELDIMILIVRRGTYVLYYITGRMKELVEQLFNNNPEGARLRARPRKIWWKCVRADLNRFGIRNWRELVMDRVGWRRAIGSD